MKKGLLGALLLLSMLSFGQNYTTKNALVENNILRVTNNFVVTDSIITMEFKDKSVVNAYKKQNLPTKIELKVKKEGNIYIAYEDKGDILKLRYLFIINDDKLVLTLESIDKFTNKILKILYY